MFCFPEVGKNINQDQALKLKRYVEGYHKFVSSLNIPTVETDTKDKKRRKRGASKGKGSLFYEN